MNYRKEEKLHEFWADKHLLKNYIFKLKRRVKASKNAESSKTELASTHYLKTLIRRTFTDLKTSVISTKTKIESISSTLIYKKRSELFRKLRRMLQDKELAV